jgi:pimeloyl-ACP methyl ester carboxylesterase
MILGRERTYLEWFYRAYSATPGVPDRHAVDEYLRTYARPAAMASAFARYRGVEREIAHNAHHARRPLAIPVLGAGGERVFGAAVADNLRHAAPHVESAVIDGCGHYVSKERPDELAELLLRFFDQRPRP